MRKIDCRRLPFAPDVADNEFAVYQIERKEARTHLKAYELCNGEKPKNDNFSKMSSKRDRLVLSAEGMDLPSGHNIIGFLGVLARWGTYWHVPHIETLYISPHLDTAWRNTVGSLLLNNSAPINRAREHRVLVSTYLDANGAARNYLQTHGFEPYTLAREDQMGGECDWYDQFTHFREQSKENLLRHIAIDLKPGST